MTPYQLEWTSTALSQFGELRQRAIVAKRYEQFRQTHREMMFDLSDLEQAARLGSFLYCTKSTPPGEVRYFLHGFIAVTNVLWTAERKGAILEYASNPASWPTCDPE